MSGTKSVLFYCFGGAIGDDGDILKCPIYNKKILNYFFLSHESINVISTTSTIST